MVKYKMSGWLIMKIDNGMMVCRSGGKIAAASIAIVTEQKTGRKPKTGDKMSIQRPGGNTYPDPTSAYIKTYGTR